jgi:hypothetical protein
MKPWCSWTSNRLKVKSLPKELHFEGVIVLTNATKYVPSNPPMASSSFHMSNFVQFQPSRNLTIWKILHLWTFFSIDRYTSLPQIRPYGTWHGTPIGNFGGPCGLAFHNLIGSAFIRLQIGSMGETLYSIIGHPKESTKNLNRCISISLTKVWRPSFKQLRTQDSKFKIS